MKKDRSKRRAARRRARIQGRAVSGYPLSSERYPGSDPGRVDGEVSSPRGSVSIRPAEADQAIPAHRTLPGQSTSAVTIQHRREGRDELSGWLRQAGASLSKHRATLTMFLLGVGSAGLALSYPAEASPGGLTAAGVTIGALLALPTGWWIAGRRSFMFVMMMLRHTAESVSRRRSLASVRSSAMNHEAEVWTVICVLSLTSGLIAACLPTVIRIVGEGRAVFEAHFLWTPGSRVVLSAVTVWFSILPVMGAWGVIQVLVLNEAAEEQRKRSAAGGFLVGVLVAVGAVMAIEPAMRAVIGVKLSAVPSLLLAILAVSCLPPRAPTTARPEARPEHGTGG